MEASVVKGGELCLMVNLSRGREGLLLNVKTSPLVEKFMQDLGNGTKDPLAKFERGFWAPNKSDELYIYNAGRDTLTQIANPDLQRYRLDRIGDRLDLSSEFGPGIINLSFLRIVGVSEADGVTLNIKGSVMSLDGLRDLKNKIGAAARALYVDFIRPVDLSVYVTQVASQEVQY